MCKDCKASPMGTQRQAELDAATAACKALNINPSIAGFIEHYAYRGHTPKFKEGEKKAADRYNAAQQAMKKLHEDFIFDGMRKAAQREAERRKEP